MDARLRNLFSRRTSQKHDRLLLTAHPYVSAVKQQSPVKGTRPVAGNGPYRLENVALQAQELAAEAPTVPRSRRHSDSSRPRTAPQSARFESYPRTRSAFSATAPSTSSRHAQRSSRASPYDPRPRAQRVRSVSAFSSDSLGSQRQPAHVDLLDAAAQINPSPQKFLRKRIASGKRDYGEDVADRNIAQFGGDEFPQHDAYSCYTDDAAQSQDESDRDGEFQGASDPRASTRGPVLRLESDGAGDDTTLLNQPTQYGTSRIYSRANQNPSSSRPPSAAFSHPRCESSNSNYSSADGIRRGGRSSSAPSHAGPFVILAPRSTAITSANLYYMTGDLNYMVSTNDSIGEVAGSSHKESRGTQTTPPRPESIDVPPIVPVTSSSYEDTEVSNSDSYDPPPILRSRLSRRIILPTPPMSPTAGESPTTSVSRASIDKDLPPPPPDTQVSPASKKHSPGGSTSYSVFPPQESRRSSKAPGPTTTVTAPDSNSTNVRPIDSKQGAFVFEGSSKLPHLEDVVDTSNTTDGEVITEQLPAVVHEHVTPRVHHIREERITREIHNHDVFHRIQPLVDVEVLPTKHYIPAPNGNDLIEIPESEIPGRHTKWAVQCVDDKPVTSVSDPSGTDMQTTAKHPEQVSDREPFVQHRQKSITNDDGIPMEQTVWRHPPQLESGGRETGQTVPLAIHNNDDEDTDEEYDTASERYAASDAYPGSEQTCSTNADGEEELLFRDSDLAFDGLLPGLEEVNPVVEGNLPTSRPSTATTRRADDMGEGEATKALRRRHEAELARKMGRLSVAEK